MNGQCLTVETDGQIRRDDFVGGSAPLEYLQGKVGGPVEIVPDVKSLPHQLASRDGTLVPPSPCVALVNEEALLSEGAVLNVYASRWIGRPLYGPVVFLTGDKEFMNAI